MEWVFRWWMCNRYSALFFGWIKDRRKKGPLLYLACNRHSMCISWLWKYYQEPQCMSNECLSKCLACCRQSKNDIKMNKQSYVLPHKWHLQSNGKTLDHLLRAEFLEHVLFFFFKQVSMNSIASPKPWAVCLCDNDFVSFLTASPRHTDTYLCKLTH